MKFLVDAQLPKRLARWLAARGHDVVHTLDMPGGNRTPDAGITDVADREERVVITKDSDFVSTHLLQKRPARLLLISTGNMGNAELEQIVERNLDAILAALETHRFVEVGRENLVVHR